MFRDQPRHDPAISEDGRVAEEFLANDQAGVNEADEQVISVAAVGGCQVRTGGPTIGEELVTDAAMFCEEGFASLRASRRGNSSLALPKDSLCAAAPRSGK